jgi:hypothetical protein
MLDDGTGHDEVGRTVPKRKSVSRRIGDDLVIELTVVAQLFIGEVERNNQMPAWRVEEWQEWALLAPADIEYDLRVSVVDQLCDLVLVKGLNVVLEHLRQVIFGSFA